jgi:acetate kinase
LLPAVTAILVINAGSSSLKFAGFRADTAESSVDTGPLFRGLLAAIDSAPRLTVRDALGAVVADRRWPQGSPISHAAGFAAIREWLDAHPQGRSLTAVGHRVVHGGCRLTAPVRVDAKVLGELDRLVPLAPLHQPHGLAIIRTIAERDPGLPQVACFDTAFHRTMPEVAQRFALPRALHDAGIRRYGFHGLSYEFIAHRLREVDPAVAAGRVVVAHLGAGASLCAMQAGRSIETTMGFTPLDGLPMGTRCGALDAGVLLHLLTHDRMDAAALTRLLYAESGLLGVSGITSDVRELAASDVAEAREAIELFVYRTACELGVMVAALGGLDALVFTAGIGEHNAAIRAAICARAGFLHLELDARANATHATRISTETSRVKVLVLPTDEERMIAMHVRGALTGAR